jgi:uncharacterized protein involved in copper resistance
LLTQRLILQPRVELNFHAQNVGELGLGSGLTEYETGLRLRYEVVREFAPCGRGYRRHAAGQLGCRQPFLRVGGTHVVLNRPRYLQALQVDAALVATI